MQNLPVYLYANSLDITLDLDPLVQGVNRVMYQRDLKIQKGLKNQIRVQFKNSDQKRITVSNTQTYIFSMFDAINQRLILEKELEILDQATTSTRGLALLTLDETDTIDLDRSSYQYSVKLQDGNNFLPTYTNTYYGVAGTLHLLSDVLPQLQDSVLVRDFAKHWDDSQQRYEFRSGNIYANPEYNGVNALHTVAFYLTNFRGQILVQATLSNSPGSNSSYATVESLEFDNFSGIEYLNFTGVYSYIRLIYIPSFGPGDQYNDNADFFGFLDKALYRS
jgi:hypothetical protein